MKRELIGGWILALAILLFLPGNSGAAKASDGRQAFGELKVFDQEGRPWRTPNEDWAGARQRVENDPAWADWLKDERKKVLSWMKWAGDRAEWNAGASHNGVNPEDGSVLVWTEKIPGEQAPFLTSRSGEKVEITPDIFAWWVVTFRTRNADMMVRAARLFRLTGDKEFAEWVSGQLDFYANHYQEWEARKGGAKLFGHPLTEAVNLIKFTEAVRLLDDQIDAERKEAWWSKLFEPEIAVLNDSAKTIHNIACWQRGAAAQIALVFKKEDIWQQAIDGPFGVREQARKGITDDFLWQEQSFSYNNYAINAFHSLFLTAGLMGRSGDFAKEMERVENLMLAPLYLRFPDGTLPNPADSIGIRKVTNLNILSETYRIFPTRLGLEEAARRRDWDTLLDPPDPSAEAAKLPEVKSANLESTRMVLLKAGRWQVFFHYGQVVKSHAQAEALNFSAYFGDIKITGDTGTTRYGYPMHKEYFTRGINHNVPLFNGEGQKSPAPGELVEFSESPPRVTATQQNYRPEGNASRTIEINGDKLEVRTVVSSEAPEKLGMALHMQGKTVLPDAFVTDGSFSKNRPKAFSYWTNVKKSADTKLAAFTISFGEQDMKLTLSANEAFTIWHATTPDSPPKKREGFYLETTGTNVTFTAVFEPIGK